MVLSTNQMFSTTTFPKIVKLQRPVKLDRRQITNTDQIEGQRPIWKLSQLNYSKKTPEDPKEYCFQTNIQ